MHIMVLMLINPARSFWLKRARPGIGKNKTPARPQPGEGVCFVRTSTLDFEVSNSPTGLIAGPISVLCNGRQTGVQH